MMMNAESATDELAEHLAPRLMLTLLSIRLFQPKVLILMMLFIQ